MYKCSLTIQGNLINQIINITLNGRVRFRTLHVKNREKVFFSNTRNYMKTDQGTGLQRKPQFQRTNII